MKEIVIASGKGGTGKTFLSSNLLYYISEICGKPSIGVDADAEAPDLALALGDYVEVYSREEVQESRKAVINYDTCSRCLTCAEVCRFNAIVVEDSEPKIIEEYCEGCGACSIVCTTGSITYKITRTGWIIYGKTRHGPEVVTADLAVSGRNTGHLVYEARERAKNLKKELEYIIVDAAPGIGCPVISSIVGANLLIICVEPTPQSYQGCLRLIDLATKVGIKYLVIINKHNLNPEFAQNIEKELGNSVIGKIPYSDIVVKSYVEMVPVLKVDNTEFSKNIQMIFEQILAKV